MRIRKIRGHRRRWKQIEDWREANINLDLDYIEESERDYTKIRIHPWSSLSFTNSVDPEPTGKTKQKILNGLLDIYESWKTQLDKLGQPYYLKIWLFEPRFCQSQIVCAVGKFIEFYNNTFEKADSEKQMIPEHYGKLKERIEKYKWDLHLDEDVYYNIEVEVGEPSLYASQKDYEEHKIWFKRLLKKPHRTKKFKEPIGEAIESYSFKRGYVWIGEKMEC